MFCEFSVTWKKKSYILCTENGKNNALSLAFGVNCKNVKLIAPLIHETNKKKMQNDETASTRNEIT